MTAIKASIGFWGQRGAEGDSTVLRSSRSRSKEKVRCPHCQGEFTVKGMVNHERHCGNRLDSRGNGPVGATRRNRGQEHCHCGEPIPPGVRACWRHTFRDDDFQALDRWIAAGLDRPRAPLPKRAALDGGGR